MKRFATLVSMTTFAGLLAAVAHAAPQPGSWVKGSQLEFNQFGLFNSQAVGKTVPSAFLEILQPLSANELRRITGALCRAKRSGSWWVGTLTWGQPATNGPWKGACTTPTEREAITTSWSPRRTSCGSPRRTLTRRRNT